MIMSSLTWYVRRRFHELNTTKTLLLQVVCGCVKWQRMYCTVGPSLIFAASAGLLRALVSSDGLHQKHESQSDVELFYRLSAWAELTDAFLVGFLFPQSQNCNSIVVQLQLWRSKALRFAIISVVGPETSVSSSVLTLKACWIKFLFLLNFHQVACVVNFLLVCFVVK